MKPRPNTQSPQPNLIPAYIPCRKPVLHSFSERGALAETDLSGVRSGVAAIGDGSSERKRMTLAVPLSRFAPQLGGG